MPTVLLMAHGGIVDELFKWMIRGFAWHAGSRIAGALPLGVIIVIAIVVFIIWLFKRRK